MASTTRCVDGPSHGAYRPAGMSERKDRDFPTDPPAPSPPERHGLVERLVKRSIESGIGAISRSEDTLRSMIDGLKLPREAASLMLDQIDETKKGLYTVVAKEIRDFLQTTNFAGDVKKVLTGMAFEVKMEVRFKDTEEDGRAAVRPDVTAAVGIKDTKDTKGRKSRRPPPPDDTDPNADDED